MLTDVDAVFCDWGGPDQAAIGRITLEALDQMTFAAGSMGLKIAAACDVIRAKGHLAAMGRLQDARAIIEGRAGPGVRPNPRQGQRVQHPLLHRPAKSTRLSTTRQVEPGPRRLLSTLAALHRRSDHRH